MKFLALSISSFCCLISGTAIIQVNKQIYSNFQALKKDEFFRKENGEEIANFNPWSLIYASGSLAYLRQLMNQIQLKDDIQKNYSEAGSMTTSSAIYISKLQNLLHSFFTNLSWEALINPVDSSAEKKQLNNANFSSFKAKFFALNSWVEIGIIALMFQIIFAMSLLASIILILVEKKLTKNMKIKLIFYYLLTNLLGWLYLRFLKNKLLVLCGVKDKKLRETRKSYLDEDNRSLLNINSGINISDLSFWLDNSQILKNINLKLQRNEFYTIMGPNGSGKTTLLKNIVGILTKTSGEIEIGGKNINLIPKKNLWRRIVYIPQELKIQPDTPVYDFLLYSRFIFLKRAQRATPIDHIKVLKAIKKYDLEKFRYSRMGELSGGQRQKVILASIMVKDAEIILLDEPTTHLDIENKNFLISLLEELKNSKKIVIANLHNFAEIAKLSSKIIAIKDGVIQKFASKEKVLKADFLNNLYDLQLSEEKWKRILNANLIDY